MKDLLDSEACSDKFPTTALNFVGYSLIASSQLLETLCDKKVSMFESSSRMLVSGTVESNLALFRGVASDTASAEPGLDRKGRPHERHVSDSLTKSDDSGSLQIWHPVSSPVWSSEVIEDSNVSDLKGNSLEANECVP